MLNYKELTKQEAKTTFQYLKQLIFIYLISFKYFITLQTVFNCLIIFVTFYKKLNICMHKRLYNQIRLNEIFSLLF